jgi:hypothetical protein
MRPIRPIDDRLLAGVQGGIANANPAAPAGDKYKDAQAGADPRPKKMTAKVVPNDLKQGIATIWTRSGFHDENHAYRVKSADPKKKTVTVHNPWETEKDVALKESELRDGR